MKVLVTGAKGLLGTDAVKHLLKEGYEVDAIDIDTLDITNENAVHDYFETSKPDWIVNCAAYTNVDACEGEGYEIAKKVNSVAPGYIARIAKKIGANLIHISTNCVSNNESPDGFDENSKITGSMNKYGETKLLGEEAVKQAFKGSKTPSFYIIRISWLFGAIARNFLYKITKLAHEKEFLTVVDDEIGCPVSTDYVAAQIIDFIKNKKDSGIYHVVSSNSCSRYDFAKKILELQDIKTEILPIKLADFERPAYTAHYSILKNTKLPEHKTWESMLEEFFKENKIKIES